MRLIICIIPGGGQEKHERRDLTINLQMSYEGDTFLCINIAKDGHSDYNSNRFINTAAIFCFFKARFARLIA
jgi:hypothetical protein